MRLAALRFLFQRVLQAVFLLIVASALSFAIIELAPGDYFDAMQLNPQVSTPTIQAMRTASGLNRPKIVQYLSWLRSVYEGNWGYSFAYHVPAGPLLVGRAGNTLLLTISATLLAWALALPLGIWAAAKHDSWIDYATSAASSLLLATPELVLALALLWLAAKTRAFPAGGIRTLNEVTFGDAGGGTGKAAWFRWIDVAHHLFLPCLCLAAGIFPIFVSHVRTAIRETMSLPFIAAARSYGIPPARIMLRHVLPAAANPLISLAGLSVGVLLSSSLLVEAVFSWPGLGQLMLQAIFQRDLFLVLDSVMFGMILWIAGNFIADVLLYAMDPRIRAE